MKDDIDQTVDKVMVPELQARHGELAGKRVKVRALPVYYSKQIYHYLQPVQSEVAKWANKYSHTDQKVPLPEDGMDVKLAESMLKACVVLADFYGLNLSEEELNKKVGLDELTAFIKVQLEVSGDSDFLLRPLQIIIKGLELLREMQPFQNLEPSELMQKLGV